MNDWRIVSPGRRPGKIQIAGAQLQGFGAGFATANGLAVEGDDRLGKGGGRGNKGLVGLERFGHGKRLFHQPEADGGQLFNLGPAGDAVENAVAGGPGDGPVAADNPGIVGRTLGDKAVLHKPALIGPGRLSRHFRQGLAQQLGGFDVAPLPAISEFRVSC